MFATLRCQVKALAPAFISVSCTLSSPITPCSYIRVRDILDAAPPRTPAAFRSEVPLRFESKDETSGTSMSVQGCTTSM